MKNFRRLLAAALTAVTLPAALLAQDRGTISGRVVEGTAARPVSGAQVRVAGTTLGTQTDEQGRFTINGVSAGARTLQVSRVGYKAVTRAVTAPASDVTVTLESDPLGLQAVVAIGYGETNRRQVTGAVASVSAEEISSQPVASLNEALQGRVAGVQVAQNSGTPGAAVSVRIRGSSSLSAGNAPLYVVDGMPLLQGNYSGFNASFGGQGVDALSDLNPNEIESVEVLKDASAAAIYGSRASNGVVLITTRKGRSGRSEINFGSYLATQSVWRTPQFLGAADYIKVNNEGLAAGLGEEYANYFGYTDDDIPNCEVATELPCSFVEVDPSVNVNWLGTVLHSAPMRDFTGSIRGGTEKARYYVSGDALNQEGVVQGQGYSRINGRMNLDYAPTSRLTLGTNLSLARAITNRQPSDNNIYSPFANAIAQPPIESAFLSDGTYNLETSYSNPVALSRENFAEERNIHVIGNTFASYTLTDWLSARASAGVDNLTLRSLRYDSPIVGVYAGSGGGNNTANSYVTKATYEGTLNFDRLFGERHQVTGVVGTSYEANTLEQNSVSGQSFPSSSFRFLNSAALINGGGSTLTRNNLLSFFGRTSYTLNDRYTATFNVRADGSSKFGSSHRYGIFPSAALLWRVSEEPFFARQGVFSDLSLRASYGRTGNQQGIGNFDARGLFGSGYNYNDVPGVAPAQLANPDLKWETTDQLNVGADFAVLNERLSFTVDAYRKNTSDLLVNLPVPLTTGYGAIAFNAGSIRNTGVELSTRAQWLQGTNGGPAWTTELNLAHNSNRVTALVNDQPLNAGFASRVEVGHAIGEFYGYVADGIFRDQAAVDAHAFQSDATAPGDVRFKDLNNDGVINDEDRTFIGTPWPKLEGGVTNTLSFKGFDLNLFAQFSRGNKIFNGTRIYTDYYGGALDNSSIRALGRWTPENPDASEPRAVYGDPNENTRVSSRFVEDGSYFRLKNATLGYTLPASTVSRFGFRSLRVYVQGQNLWTSTKYSGFDPEVNYAGDTPITRGTDFYTLPQLRTLTTGFDIGF